MAKLQVDRANIDNKYSIIPAMPLPTATETLEWVTRIFISGTLSETRTALAQYPAITINYKFQLGLGNRPWLETLAMEAQLPSTNPRNEYVLPYFPHGMPATVSGNTLTANTAVDPVNSLTAIRYPYNRYYLKYDRYRFIYDQLPITAAPFRDGDEVWITPCFVAFIDPAVVLEDLGKCRHGHKVNLLFRMTGESERLMTYTVDNFNFMDALQSPLDSKVTRHQTSFMPLPAIPNTYTPVAYQASQQRITDVDYWLEYDQKIRQDYTFRGIWMKNLGSYTAGNYIETGKLHRLVRDRITIKYDLGAITASGQMREVAA